MKWVVWRNLKIRKKTVNKELLEVVRAALDYIDALPKEVVACLPTMPGFDRDWAENVIAEAQKNDD